MKKIQWKQGGNKMDKKRCEWVTNDPIYIKYHDEEWGSLDQFQDDHYLFEMLILEGAQAGLNWITILKRRQNYRKAFDYFDPVIVASYTEDKKNELLNNKGIIRNKRKIESAIKNAKAFLDIQNTHGSFHEFLWEFVGKKQVINHWKRQEDVPASTNLSVQLSEELRKRGFSFVGPIICYSYLQAVGLINDHIEDCFLNGG